MPPHGPFEKETRAPAPCPLAQFMTCPAHQPLHTREGTLYKNPRQPMSLTHRSAAATCPPSLLPQPTENVQHTPRMPARGLHAGQGVPDASGRGDCAVQLQVLVEHDAAVGQLPVPQLLVLLLRAGQRAAAASTGDAELSSLGLSDAGSDVDDEETRSTTSNGSGKKVGEAKGEAKTWRARKTLKKCVYSSRLVDCDMLTMHSHLDAVRCLAFDRTEMTLASGSDDCTVKVWRMSPVQVVAGGCVSSRLHAVFTL